MSCATAAKSPTKTSSASTIFLYIQGNYAISMEYFPSHTLGGEIINEKPVDLKRAVKFGIDIATGMAVAHQAGICAPRLEAGKRVDRQRPVAKE